MSKAEAIDIARHPPTQTAWQRLRKRQIMVYSWHHENLSILAVFDSSPNIARQHDTPFRGATRMSSAVASLALTECDTPLVQVWIWLVLA